MPVLFIEASPGIRPEKKRLMMQKITEAGSVDFKISEHFAIRPVQAEYFLTKFTDGANNRQNYFRYSAGIVFRFGTR